MARSLPRTLTTRTQTWNPTASSGDIDPAARFGAYATDEFARQPEAFNPVLKEVDFTAVSMAA